MNKILVIDDQIDITKNIKAILEDESYKVDTAINSTEAVEFFQNQDYDLIILDVWLDNSDLDGMQLLKKIRKISKTPVIIISGHGNIDMAVKAIKDGANEFIEKPFNSERLILSVSRSIELFKIQKENKLLKRENIKDYTFIGNSNAIVKIKQLIKKIGPSSSRVMIYGDSGTGKDIVAKEIHLNSSHSEGPFIVINAALMEPQNIEKELFGSIENDINNEGYLEKAENGTLFIDEVGEMPLQTQAKILRVLTDKFFSKMGSSQNINLKCRIICSSTKDLDLSVSEGSFRKDLFHRLNVVSIKLPNLSERVEDLDGLIDYFSSQFTAENNYTSENLKLMIKSKYINYDWPGNIRELRNVIERHVILGDSSIDTNIIKNENNNISEKNVISLPLKNARKIFEKNYLQSQINRFDGNISKTATFIGMERSALHRKLKQLGITYEDK